MPVTLSHELRQYIWHKLGNMFDLDGFLPTEINAGDRSVIFDLRHNNCLGIFGK